MKTDPETQLQDAINAYIAATEPDAIAGSWIILCEINTLADLDAERATYTTITHGNALTITGMLAAAQPNYVNVWGQDQ